MDQKSPTSKSSLHQEPHNDGFQDWFGGGSVVLKDDNGEILTNPDASERAILDELVLELLLCGVPIDASHIHLSHGPSNQARQTLSLAGVQRALKGRARTT